MSRSEISVQELESGEQLLRFALPLVVECETSPDGEVALHSSLLDLGAAGINEQEAWEMFTDLVVSTFAAYWSSPEPPSFAPARQQWRAVRAAHAKLYSMQPA